ncbi:MAG: hypothetical protein ABIK99_01605 [candidate division WOR-3 bacterium]
MARERFSSKVILPTQAEKDIDSPILKLPEGIFIIINILKKYTKLKWRYKPHPDQKANPGGELFYKAKESPIGYTEIDLLHHGRLSSRGTFCYTLMEIEINTGWTE